MAKSNTSTGNKKGPAPDGSNKPKMTKAERKEKYTKIARERSAKQALRAKGQRLVCLRCRQRGHLAETCPQAASDSTKAGKQQQQQQSSRKCCYKCGSTEHGLKACPLRNSKHDDGSLPFAECFVCGKKGHLASQCTDNEKGIYVNGGACNTCGSKQHLSKDCPQRQDSSKKNKTNPTVDDEETEQYYADMLLQGDDHEITKHPSDSKNSKRTEKESSDTQKKGPKKSRVVKF